MAIGTKMGIHELTEANISDFPLPESASNCHEMLVRPSHNLLSLIPKTNLAVISIEFSQCRFDEHQIFERKAWQTVNFHYLGLI